MSTQATTFISKVQQLGYQAQRCNNIYNGAIATVTTNCNITFTEFIDNKTAKEAFNTAKYNIKNIFGVKKSSDGIKSNKYSIKIQDRYIVYTRSQNCLIEVNCSIQYADMIDGIIKQLGY